MDALDGLARRQLALAGTGWSIGVLGALAEFHRNAHEPCQNGALSAVTERGAIALELLPEARAIAYETVTQNIDSWNHGIALCLPDSAAAMHGRHVLTEIGPDRDALR